MAYTSRRPADRRVQHCEASLHAEVAPSRSCQYALPVPLPPGRPRHQPVVQWTATGCQVTTLLEPLLEARPQRPFLPDESAPRARPEAANPLVHADDDLNVWSWIVDRHWGQGRVYYPTLGEKLAKTLPRVMRIGRFAHVLSDISPAQVCRVRAHPRTAQCEHEWQWWRTENPVLAINVRSGSRSRRRPPSLPPRPPEVC